jgi:hypothetical protein
MAHCDNHGAGKLPAKPHQQLRQLDPRTRMA